VVGLTTGLKDPASLVTFQSVVRVELVLKDPFTGDYVGANGARNKIPGVIGDQGSKLFFHWAMIIQIGEGSMNGDGHW
jgi:hypothetical protein